MSTDRPEPVARLLRESLTGRIGRKWHRSFRLRILVQTGFALTCVLVGVQFARFVSAAKAGAAVLPVRPPGVEGFLPIGGLLGAVDWAHQGTLNRVHPAATVLFLVFVAIAFVARKSFCSWVCPAGFLSDLLARLGRFFFGRNFRIWRWLDVPLRSLKYLLLAFFVWAIWKMPAEGGAGIHRGAVLPALGRADGGVLRRDGGLRGGDPGAVLRGVPGGASHRGVGQRDQRRGVPLPAGSRGGRAVRAPPVTSAATPPGRGRGLPPGRRLRARIGLPCRAGGRGAPERELPGDRRTASRSIRALRGATSSSRPRDSREPAAGPGSGKAGVRRAPGSEPPPPPFPRPVLPGLGCVVSQTGEARPEAPCQDRVRVPAATFGVELGTIA